MSDKDKIYTQEDLDDARQEGYEDGYDEGHEEGYDSGLEDCQETTS